MDKQNKTATELTPEQMGKIFGGASVDESTQYKVPQRPKTAGQAVYVFDDVETPLGDDPTISPHSKKHSRCVDYEPPV